MAVRRQSSLDLNFDSLTDTITNLCGGLILLVMLVVGATEPKKEGRSELPPPENKVGAETRADKLLDELQSLSASVKQVAQDVEASEMRLPELEAELAKLAKK